jgi:hypothetical protein
MSETQNKELDFLLYKLNYVESRMYDIEYKAYIEYYENIEKELNGDNT